ncbi:Uncharacterised protein [Bordetella pertussis]|nr:Uncharacterised protein [Bordetella pertussis]
MRHAGLDDAPLFQQAAGPDDRDGAPEAEAKAGAVAAGAMFVGQDVRGADDAAQLLDKAAAVARAGRGGRGVYH